MLDLKPNKKLAINAIDYLEKAAQILLKEIILPVADKATVRKAKFQFTISFPKGSKKAIGQCFSVGESQSKKHNLITIKPVFGSTDTQEVLSITHHEILHAIDNTNGVNMSSGHKRGGFFHKTAVASGLTGKMTATVPTPELVKKYEKLIISKLGGFPFEAIDERATPSKPPQKNRNLKLSCDLCDIKFNTSRTQIEEIEGPCLSKTCHHERREGREGGMLTVG